MSRLAAMRGRLVKPLLVCVFALTFAGCGSGDDGTIPQDEADDLLSVLETMQSQIEEGECEFVDENATEFVDRVNALPGDVDPEVASELTKAADNLRVLAAQPDQCAETGATGITGTTTTETPDTTDTEATVTETTTPEEETTTEEPAEEEPAEEPSPEPPATGGGNEGGNQGGDGAPTPDEDLEPPGGTGGVEPNGKSG